jgi:hypothetical protein
MKNLFVTGLDKVRSDYSCCVWDINQTGAQGSGSLHIGEPVFVDVEIIIIILVCSAKVDFVFVDFQRRSKIMPTTCQASWQQSA